MKKLFYTLLLATIMVAGLSAQNLNIHKTDGSVVNIALSAIDSITFSGNTPIDSDILMNEIFSRGTDEDPDWIEVYNLSAAPIDISGYKIYDGGGQSGSKPKKEFPAGTVIPANGFVVIVTDDADPSGFGLSSGGEEVWLEDASGVVIDDVVFPAMAEVTYSYGRQPDGTANFFIFTEITKGSSNNNATILP